MLIQNEIHWGSLPSIQVKKISLSVSLNAINPNLFGKNTLRAFKLTTKHEKNKVTRDKISMRRYTPTIRLHLGMMIQIFPYLLQTMNLCNFLTQTVGTVYSEI